ncbi:MAG: SDR family oxidoreductase [Coriobacteriales bacterium]|nr:SDR family oxidoreductase [Coriobacteriales bacterium]
MSERQSVIVTGGSSGIGLATALAYARRGADVAIVGRDEAKLEAARERLLAGRASEDQRIASHSADLSQFEAARDAIDTLVAQGFAPDVLVNSAGVIVPGEFVTMPLEHFERNMHCGYWSVVYPCRAAAPHMIARGSGNIVNVSSVAGYLGIYGYTGYSSAKFASMGFTEALRFEMKPHGVRVHVVCPPDTDTPALAYEHTLRPPETDVIAGNIKPISAQKVADAIVRGVDKGRYYIIPDATSSLYFRLKGILPELFFAIVDGDVAKARKANGA